MIWAERIVCVMKGLFFFLRSRHLSRRESSDVLVQRSTDAVSLSSL